MSKFLDEVGLNYLINKYKSRFKTDRLDITKDGESYLHTNITSSGSVQMVVDKGEFKLKNNYGNLAFETPSNAKISSGSNIVMESHEGIQATTHSDIYVYTQNQFLLNSVRNSEFNSNGSCIKLGSDSEITVGGNLSITALPKTIFHENDPDTDEDDVRLDLSGDIEMQCTGLKTRSKRFDAIIDNYFGVVSTYDDYPHHLIRSSFEGTAIQSFVKQVSDQHALIGELKVGEVSSLRGNKILMKFCNSEGELEEEFDIRNVIKNDIDDILDKELPLERRYIICSMHDLLINRCFYGGCPVQIIPGNMCAWIICERIDDSEELSNEYTLVKEYYKVIASTDSEGNDIIKYANVYIKKTTNLSSEDSGEEDTGEVEDQA